MDIERIEKDYPDFKKITSKGSFVIPGLRSTPVVDREDCDEKIMILGGTRV